MGNNDEKSSDDIVPLSKETEIYHYQSTKSVVVENQENRLLTTKANELEDSKVDDEVRRATTSLSRQQWWNISCLVLAWACVVASMTIVVGTGAVVVKSVGGSNELAPFSLGAFFLGMSLVSATCTHWIFAAWGRKIGFFIGISIGFVGVAIGLVAIVVHSATVVIIANFCLGAGSGVGMHVRFAAVEVVPSDPGCMSRAMTWVLSGGCIAAFLGPETSQAAKDSFGEENLGIFFVTGLFYLAQAIFICFVKFPTTKSEQKSSIEESDDVGGNLTLWSVLKRRAFIIPVLVATMSWTIMLIPMSIFRVAMDQLGYTKRQSLTVIEMHFLAMYGPGFCSGKLIAKYGPWNMSVVAVFFSIVATIVNIVSQDNAETVVTWYLGLIVLGIGWNFGFSSSTMWVTKCYNHNARLKPKIQATNDCIMFLLSGAGIFSTGYIFEAGGSALDGWRTLQYVLFLLIGVMACILILDKWLLGKEKESDADMELTQSNETNDSNVESEGSKT